MSLWSQGVGCAGCSPDLLQGAAGVVVLPCAGAPAGRCLSGADPRLGQQTFPAPCGTTLNKGEEALAFLFFDLAACIQNDAEPIVIP